MVPPKRGGGNFPLEELRDGQNPAYDAPASAHAESPWRSHHYEPGASATARSEKFKTMTAQQPRKTLGYFWHGATDPWWPPMTQPDGLTFTSGPKGQAAKACIENLRRQRKWLIEQLAGAWGWTEQEVSERLFEDTRP